MPAVEVRAFAKLYLLFKERGWENPISVELSHSMTADELRQELDIPAEEVEVVFINRMVRPLSTTLHGGERVAFVPPGVPSVHRFWLGFYNQDGEDPQDNKNKPGKS